MIIESASKPTFVEIIEGDLQKNEQYNKTLYWDKLNHSYIFYLLKLHILMCGSTPFSQTTMFSSSLSIFLNCIADVTQNEVSSVQTLKMMHVS